ncbi:MAG: M24 family metallopeptidase C-terminal domain-containing protein [Alphaproteobacteria bacterium]|nr:M24 family metallopeptidase C-terminal domain-containing protein [Alphaproteobacteria bacterium]
MWTILKIRPSQKSFCHTKWQKSGKLIDETLLTEKEKKWIKDYHKRCEDVIQSKL